jgi:DNA-binding NarL/FixJ family response regulator
MTSVLIVDDHSIFRSGLRADLDETVQVLGEAADVDSAVAQIALLRPEVVLLDVHLPGGAGGGGAEVIRGSAALLDRVRFLALPAGHSPFEEPDNRRRFAEELRAFARSE